MKGIALADCHEACDLWDPQRVYSQVVLPLKSQLISTGVDIGLGGIMYSRNDGSSEGGSI